MKLKTVLLLSTALLMAVSILWAQQAKEAPDPADVSYGYCDPVLSNWGLDVVSWSQVGSAIVPFIRAASGFLGNYVYCFGEQSSNVGQAYNINTQVWVSSTPPLLGDCNWCGVTTDDAIYIVGRYSAAGYGNEVQKFTPTAGGPTGTWVFVAPYPVAACGVAAAWDGGNFIYAAGGNPTLSNAYKYDIANNTWTAIASLPVATPYLGGAFCQGKFYCLGGINTPNSNYEYDPATNTWASRAAVPVAIHFATFSTTKNQSYVLSIGGGGGYGSWPATNAVQIYDPLTDTWTQETTLPQALGCNTGIWIGGAGDVLSAGGYDGLNYHTEAYIGTNFPGGAQPGAPASPTNFTVEDNGATLLASLSWINPTTQVNGNPLTSIDSVVVLRNDVMVHFWTTATPGQAMSWDDNTITAAGMYSYRVYCVNSAGPGISASASAWIGPDVPDDVNNLLLTPAPNYQLSGTLTWVNPTSGAHGGFYPGITGYNIERSDGATFNQVGQTTTYVDNTIPDADYYHYTVTPYNNSGEGMSATSNTAWIGVPEIWIWEEITYVWNDISSVGTNAGLTSDDQNVGPFPLGFDFEFFNEQTFSQIRFCSNGFQSFTSTATTFTNAVIPTAAEPNNLIASFWEDLSFTSGGICYYYANAGAQTFTIQYTNVPYYTGGGTVTFQVVLDNTDGTISVYYNTIGTNNGCTVGIENATGTEGVQVCFDGSGTFLPTSNSAIRFNPPVPGVAGQPNVVTNLEAFAGFAGALSCSLHWVNPTTDALGQPLTDLLGVKIVRMDTIIANLTPVTIGAPMSYVDNSITQSGLYEYTVYGYNSTYDGLSTTTDPLWIGEDTPGTVTNLLMEPAPGYAMYATLTWQNPTAGAHGGYFTTILGYHIERSDGAVFTLLGPNTTYVDNTVPTPDYYYYEVAPYNSIGDGPTSTSNTAYVGLPQIYTWEEITYTWNDISGVGINSGLNGDDQNVGPFPLGLDFLYYENTYSTIRICSNGWASFTSTATIYSNPTIPTAAEPNNVLAPFWDDLTVSTGTVYYYADAVNHKFTIQYQGVPRLGSTEPNTFQIVLHSDGTVVYNYNTIGSVNNNCTVGIENREGNDGIQVCYNGVGDFIPISNTSIRFNPPIMGFGSVAGHVTLDGAVGNITNVRIDDGFGAVAYCNASGNYQLDSARVGDRFITASMAGFFHDSTRIVTVILDSLIQNIDFTLRRLEPSTPTGLAASIDTSNGQVVLNWDAHPDPTVDRYFVQRKLAGMPWTSLGIVNVPNHSYTSTLPSYGQWFFQIAAVDLNVLPPPSQSQWTDSVEVIWGELPPNSLTANGQYDDRIRLNWNAPGTGFDRAAPATNTRSNQANRFETDQVLLYYKIYRDAAYLDTCYTTQYFNTGLVENVQHSYYVTGYYDNGAESGASNTVTATCNMSPAAPGNFFGTANATEDSMILTWDDPTLNRDGTPCVDLAQLTISRDGTFLANVSPGVERYVDGPPSPTQFYTWSIVAKDEVPNSSVPATFTSGIQSPWSVVPHVWEDISAIGTNSGLNGDDQNVGPFNLGFSFPFYDNSFTSIRICSNGFLSFTSTATTFTNTSIPNTAEPNNMLAPFWDDLTLSTSGTVYYYSDPVEHTFTVQYDQVPHLSAGGPYTFQAVLTDGGAIYYHYHVINDPNNSCTVGIENATGTDAIQVCFDGAGEFIPVSGTSVYFQPPELGNLEGYVYENATPNDPIENAAVEVGNDTARTDVNGHYLLEGILAGTFNATASAFGYVRETEQVVIVNNITTEQDFYLTQPLISVDVSSIDVDYPIGTPSHQETFNISNLGDGTLEYSIRIAGQGGVESILLVDDDGGPNNGGTYADVQLAFTQALDAAGLDYDVFIVNWVITTPPQNGPTYAEMSDYDAVIWFTGETWGYYGDDTITNTDEMNLADYLDDGGKLFLSAQDYFYESYPTAGPFYAGQFPYDYLGVTSATQDVYTPPLTAVGGTGSFAQGMTFACTVPYPSATLWADQIQTSGTALLLGDGQGPSACQYEGNNFSTAFTTISFEGLVDGAPPSTKAQFMANLIEFLGGGRAAHTVSAPPQETVTPEPSFNPAARSASGSAMRAQSTAHPAAKTVPANIMVGPVRHNLAHLDEVDEPWVTAVPDEGTVEPQESELITLTFIMPDTAIIGDQYSADLVIENNTITPEIIIPITVDIVTSVTQSHDPLPLEYKLYQNYPNPFNPTTRIRFDLRERSHVVLEIVNILGQKVTTVIDRNMDAGSYAADFDASRLASGLYFYRITANNFTDLKKMVLVK